MSLKDKMLIKKAGLIMGEQREKLKELNERISISKSLIDTTMVHLNKTKTKHQKATAHIRELVKKNQQLEDTILLQEENHKNSTKYFKEQLNKSYGIKGIPNTSATDFEKHYQEQELKIKELETELYTANARLEQANDSMQEETALKEAYREIICALSEDPDKLLEIFEYGKQTGFEEAEKAYEE